MSIPKNQHYVPAFYLNNFSVDDDGRIASYNYKSGELSKHSAIKRVASQDNFYGENSEIEKTYAYIESKASKIIRQIITSDQLRRNDIAGGFILWLYTFLQSTRTYKRIEQFPSILKNAAENAKGISLKDAEIIKNLEFPSSAIMALTYQNLFRILPDTLDLHYKLIINKSSLPFITSDHPVFTYNQFMEKRVPIYNGNGLLIKGTQVFLPISAKHLIVFFDKNIYKLSSAKKDVCTTSLIEDIKSINSLSALNAGSKAFFSNPDAHKPYNYYVGFRDKYLKRATGTEIPKTGLKLSFFKELDKAKCWTPNGPLSYFRDEKAGFKNLLIYY